MPSWIIREIMPEILAAIEATDRSIHVFYVVGAGGIGKTILLRQVGMQLGSPDGTEPALRWTGIVDLYHSNANTNSGLEERLRLALEKAGEFQDYRTERDAYKAQREAGLVGGELEEERLKLAEVFAQCMNKVTAKRRVVVALDTTERIQYETDTIQKLCQLESESATVKVWLLDQLNQWRNCVVLLAGRPEPALQNALDHGLAGTAIHYHPVQLHGFTEREALDYFDQQQEQYHVVRELFDLNLRQRLWQVTEGKPIRLALAIYVAEYQLGFDKFTQKIYESSLPQALTWIDQELISRVMQDDPTAPISRILRYLAVARKGLDADLLHHLVNEWTLDECQLHLDAVADRAFVKQRPEEERLFLHDEMYDLCDKYLVDAPQVQELSGKLVKWYDKQIDCSQNAEQRQNCEVESVLYRLRANPRHGYHWYAQLADEAIRYAEVGLDMRLRNELWAFLLSSSPIDQQLLRDAPNLDKEIECDCASSWVKRFQVRALYDKATLVARTVKATYDFYPPHVAGSQLSRADLDVYYAQVLIYQGKVTEAIDLLHRVIDELETGRKPEELARQGDPHEFEGWRRNLLLGRGHNNLGYAYWWIQKHCHLALQEFRAALPYFRASDLLEESANTLDNMGRVYTTLYQRSRADSLIEDGLELRRKLGRDYRIAMSLSSRSIAYIVFDEPHRARRLSEEALNIFERLGTQRGIGTASTHLGHALRKLGSMWAVGLYSPDECDRFLRDAMTHLERAVDIFENMVQVPVYMIAACNELGCTYRERAALARAGTPRPSLAHGLVRNAVKLLERSVQLAQDGKLPLQCADTCEDLAQVFFQQQEYNYAEHWLQNAESHIPDIYKFKPDVEPGDIAPVERIEEFWQTLGKIELHRGCLAYDTGQKSDGEVPREVLEQATEHFVLAYAYFERFSVEAAGLEHTLKQLYSRFKKCRYDDLRYVQDELLPRIAQTYSLDPTKLAHFFEDTLGLAVLQLEEQD